MYCFSRFHVEALNPIDRTQAPIRAMKPPSQPKCWKM